MTLFNFFQDENKAQGATGRTEVGKSNVDSGQLAELGVQLPWVKDPEYSYLVYDCWVECVLDPGIALHRPLPQSPSPIDTLASADVAVIASSLDTTHGVNHASQGRFTDIAQRMANSEYRFILHGFALRAGYKVPIPGLKSVAGVPAIPDYPQRAYNKIVDNCSGIPLFLAEWELHYFVLLPPTSEQLPPPNIADHIRPDVKLPEGMNVPLSQVDQNAIPGSSTLHGHRKISDFQK